MIEELKAHEPTPPSSMEGIAKASATQHSSVIELANVVRSITGSEFTDPTSELGLKNAADVHQTLGNHLASQAGFIDELTRILMTHFD